MDLDLAMPAAAFAAAIVVGPQQFPAVFDNLEKEVAAAADAAAGPIGPLNYRWRQWLPHSHGWLATQDEETSLSPLVLVFYTVSVS